MRSSSAGSRSARLTPRLPVDASAPFVRQAANRSRTLYSGQAAGPEGQVSSTLPARCVTSDTPRRGTIFDTSTALFALAAASGRRVESATSRLSPRSGPTHRRRLKLFPLAGSRLDESSTAHRVPRAPRRSAPHGEFFVVTIPPWPLARDPKATSERHAARPRRFACASLCVSRVVRFE